MDLVLRYLFVFSSFIFCQFTYFKKISKKYNYNSFIFYSRHDFIKFKINLNPGGRCPLEKLKWKDEMNNEVDMISKRILA